MQRETSRLPQRRQPRPNQQQQPQQQQQQQQQQQPPQRQQGPLLLYLSSSRARYFVPPLDTLLYPEGAHLAPFRLLLGDHYVQYPSDVWDKAVLPRLADTHNSALACACWKKQKMKEKTACSAGEEGGEEDTRARFVALGGKFANRQQARHFTELVFEQHPHLQLEPLDTNNGTATTTTTTFHVTPRDSFVSRSSRRFEHCVLDAEPVIYAIPALHAKLAFPPSYAAPSSSSSSSPRIPLICVLRESSFRFVAALRYLHALATWEPAVPLLLDLPLFASAHNTSFMPQLQTPQRQSQAATANNAEQPQQESEEENQRVSMCSWQSSTIGHVTCFNRRCVAGRTAVDGATAGAAWGGEEWSHWGLAQDDRQLCQQILTDVIAREEEEVDEEGDNQSSNNRAPPAPTSATHINSLLRMCVDAPCMSRRLMFLAEHSADASEEERRKTVRWLVPLAASRLRGATRKFVESVLRPRLRDVLVFYLDMSYTISEIDAALEAVASQEYLTAIEQYGGCAGSGEGNGDKDAKSRRGREQEEQGQGQEGDEEGNVSLSPRRQTVVTLRNPHNSLLFAGEQEEHEERQMSEFGSWLPGNDDDDDDDDAEHVGGGIATASAPSSSSLHYNEPTAASQLALLSLRLAPFDALCNGYDQRLAGVTALVLVQDNTKTTTTAQSSSSSSSSSSSRVVTPQCHYIAEHILIRETVRHCNVVASVDVGATCGNAEMTANDSSEGFVMHQPSGTVGRATTTVAQALKENKKREAAKRQRANDERNKTNSNTDDEHQKKTTAKSSSINANNKHAKTKKDSLYRMAAASEFVDKLNAEKEARAEETKERKTKANNNRSSSSLGIAPLPFELQQRLLQYLTPRYLCSAQCVCAMWFHCIHSDTTVLLPAVCSAFAVSEQWRRFMEHDWGEKSLVLSDLFRHRKERNHTTHSDEQRRRQQQQAATPATADEM